MTTTIPYRATSINSASSLPDAFADLLKREKAEPNGPHTLESFLKLLSGRWNNAVGLDFESFALPHQRPPAFGNNGEPWTTWLLIGGRGAGKTRAGAEWVRTLALADGRARIALIGETEHETREVMVEGVSGLLSVHRARERPQWSSTRRRLEWRSGAVAQLFSAENPDALRGPQFSAAWLDELAKWRQKDCRVLTQPSSARAGAANDAKRDAHAHKCNVRPRGRDPRYFLASSATKPLAGSTGGRAKLSGMVPVRLPRNATRLF
jgi:hypothetical protein